MTAPQVHAQRALSLTAELLRVGQALDRACIPYVTFKGPTLSMTLYNDVGTRTYGDIDIILPASEIVRARRVLEDCGFRPYLDVGDRQLAWFTGILNEYAMHTNSTVVELHWAVARPGYRFSLAYEDLAPHRTTMTIAGRSVPILENEVMVVVLAVHGSKHGWSRASWLKDFADLALGEHPLDWDRVFAIAEEHGAIRFVLQAA